MQKTLCKNTSHPWGVFVEVFFLKNTSTKNTSHPWGVFVDRTFPLQKDFTPVGSFCRSVLQEKYGQQKDPTGVKCFSRTKTPSQKDPSTDFRNSRKVPDSPESDSQPRPIPCRTLTVPYRAVPYRYRTVRYGTVRYGPARSGEGVGVVGVKVYLGKTLQQKHFTPVGCFC